MNTTRKTPHYVTPNDRVLEQIRANRSFDGHEITRERFGVWYCGQKDTGNYSFRVVSSPGMLMLYGDIGEIIFLPHDRNSLRWAVGAKFDPLYPYYPMTKLSPQMREKEFQPEHVSEWLNERIQDSRKNSDNNDTRRYVKMAREWREASRDSDYEARQAYYEICHESGDYDPPDFCDYPLGIYYCFQAMCWFMSHVDATDSRFTEELKP